MIGLETCHLCDELFRRQRCEQALELLTLRILGHVELERSAHRAHERLRSRSPLGDRRGGTDKAFVTAQLAQRLAADARDSVGQVRVGKALEVLLEVLGLGLGRKPVLGHEERGRLPSTARTSARTDGMAMASEIEVAPAMNPW